LKTRIVVEVVEVMLVITEVVVKVLIVVVEVPAKGHELVFQQLYFSNL